ncbi:malonate decarboxylase holo-ACP synthase [Massilia sp. TN1-12]|uniref:malonate decarboxylase holo-ACP synthase n=1 Tax=Massilia paldalensis TaxID=3377675 RepID=UPI0038514C25
MYYGAHDLLFLGEPGAFEPVGPRPDWLGGAWQARAPLVVRREATSHGRLPVGARGPLRNQRLAGYVDGAVVQQRVTPEMLAQAPVPAGPPCLAALARLAPRLAGLGLAWGPIGGVGFQLASGLPVLRETSDLDLLVRAPRPLPAGTVAALAALQRDADCRIDIQVDTGSGGFALAEYARGGRVLLKTAHGPVLLDDPWQGRWQQDRWQKDEAA